MIARYDGNSAGRWSATGVVFSLLVCGVALTGAVRGQDAAGEKPAPPEPRAVEARPAAEAKPTETKQAFPPGYAGLSEQEVGQKLWDEKYAQKIFHINRVEANREQVDREYLAELERTKQAMRAVGALRAAPERRGAADAVEDEDVDREVLAQLERQLPELNFDAAPLADVIDFLRDVSGGANLVVNWRAMENAGVDRNAPVSARLRNVQFSKALTVILDGVSGGTVPLGYTIDRNVILISTGEDLDRVTDIRAYDVRDIVPAEMPMQELTKMITEAVAPDSWRESGGSVGTVHASKHKLIVKQTPMNHREVRDVLRMLREEPGRYPEAADAASAAQAPAAQPRQ